MGDNCSFYSTSTLNDRLIVIYWDLCILVSIFYYSRKVYVFFSLSRSTDRFVRESREGTQSIETHNCNLICPIFGDYETYLLNVIDRGVRIYRKENFFKLKVLNGCLIYVYVWTYGFIFYIHQTYISFFISFFISCTVIFYQYASVVYQRYHLLPRFI